MHEPSFLWYDFETFGTSGQKDLPCQFAAIRTDLDFNIIGKPINIMSAIANDYLPHPEACLVTGITPQQTLRDGSNEADFAKRIYQEMSTPNTCSLGFNSIRFDDEVASPDGINWPTREDGTPSFKLEHLTKENDISHENAHDALSDVHATIALAKLIKEKQPRLFEYAYSLRSKHNVANQFDLTKPSVLLHISAKLPASQGCCTWIMPIAKHPTNSNAIIAVDLSKPIDSLLNDSPEEIKAKLYARYEPGSDANSLRPGLKLIHINRSPFVTTAKAMTEGNAHRLGLDRDTCLENYRILAQERDLGMKLSNVYENDTDDKEQDIDHALYSGGFLSTEDRHWCDKVLASSPEQLGALAEETQHVGLRALLFRYRARNFPSTLTYDETLKWQRHRQARLTDPTSSASITLEHYMSTLERLAHEHVDNPEKQAILRALFQYAENL